MSKLLDEGAQMNDEPLSTCCGAPNHSVGEDGPDFSDIGICPECHEHCEFERETDG